MNVLILASASPRRREILANARIPFIVMTQEASETLPESVRTPEATVRYLSFQKAEAAAERILSGQDVPESPDPCGCVFVVGADTIVASDGMILGKPADEKDAYRMLKRLSGRQHDVFTGVTILKIEERRVCARDTFFEKTAVFVEPMTDREIRWYISTKEPMDKAGAYGIQGVFSRFIGRIEGDYSNVVGLPVAALSRHLDRIGFRLYEQ